MNNMSHLQAHCPNGHLIIGTLEILSGRADLSGFTKTPEGVIEADYEGYTEVFWDEQRTALLAGQEIFLCDQGDEFTTTELTFSELA